MPMPSALLVKNGSKISFNLSSGMPEPRSDTDSWAKFSTREVRIADDAIFARRILHRVDPVHDKVQNDLLKLDAVAKDRKRIRRDHTSQFDLSSNGKRKEIRRSLATTSLKSRFFSSKGAFFSRLRILRMTSLARRSSRKISSTISLSSAISGLGDFRIASAVSALVRIEPKRLVDFMSD